MIHRRQATVRIRNSQHQPPNLKRIFKYTRKQSRKVIDLMEWFSHQINKKAVLKDKVIDTVEYFVKKRLKTSDLLLIA